MFLKVCRWEVIASWDNLLALVTELTYIYIVYSKVCLPPSTLPETIILPLKIHGWKMKFPELGHSRPIFRGELLVSGRVPSTCVCFFGDFFTFCHGIHHHFSPSFGEYLFLVGSFNPFEKYARQIGSFPQGSGWKFQKCLSCHHLVIKWVSHLQILWKTWRSVRVWDATSIYSHL